MPHKPPAMPMLTCVRARQSISNPIYISPEATKIITSSIIKACPKAGVNMLIIYYNENSAKGRLSRHVRPADYYAIIKVHGIFTALWLYISQVLN